MSRSDPKRRVSGPAERATNGHADQEHTRCRRSTGVREAALGLEVVGAPEDDAELDRDEEQEREPVEPVRARQSRLVVVRELRRGREADRAVRDRHRGDCEQRGRDEDRTPVRACPDRHRDRDERQDSEPRRDRVRLDERHRCQRSVAIGERRLKRRDDERPCDPEQCGSRQRHGEGAPRREQERPGRDPACGGPEGGATPDAHHESIAGDSDRDCADRDQGGVQADDRTRDVELLPERGQRRPERVEEEPPEAEHPVAKTRELVALEAGAIAVAELHAASLERRTPARGGRSKIRRRPTLPGGCPPSTIGADGLNFSVRNGKRCTPVAMTAESCQGRVSTHLQNSIATSTSSQIKTSGN